MWSAKPGFAIVGMNFWLSLNENSLNDDRFVNAYKAEPFIA